MSQHILFTNDVVNALEKTIDRLAPNGIIVFTDDNVARLVVDPILKPAFKHHSLQQAPIFAVNHGEGNKTIDQAVKAWEFFAREGITRKSLVINIGGGLTTDMGGFVAACFKRGVEFVNVPTTILGAVDASVGGKTAVNFNGLKNEIGVFKMAETVVISSRFFSTLSTSERLSGFAEMIKHALLSSEEDFLEILTTPIADNDFLDTKWLDILRKSVDVKQKIVRQDPTEKGLRKALNLGHTLGHAIESFALANGNPVPHGFAVAWGLVGTLILSHFKFGLSTTHLNRLAAFVKENYGVFKITCEDYNRLYSLMLHDKKNSSPSAVNYTLLSDIGKPEINREITLDDTTAMLDIYRDLFGL